MFEKLYSLLHLECYFILISNLNLNLSGLFSTERGKGDLENKIIDWDLRWNEWHSKLNRLYLTVIMCSTYVCAVRTFVQYVRLCPFE